MKLMFADLRQFLIHSRNLVRKSSNNKHFAVQAFLISFNKLIILSNSDSSDIHQVIGDVVDLAFNDSKYPELLSNIDSKELQQLFKVKLFNGKSLSNIVNKLTLLKDAVKFNDDLLRFVVLLYTYVLITIQIKLKQLNVANIRLIKQLIDLVADYVDCNCSYSGNLKDLSGNNFFRGMIQYNKLIV